MCASLALPSAGLAAATSLRVSFHSGGTNHTLSLRCAPASGTLPHPEAACRQLAALNDPTAPRTGPSVCIQGYPTWLTSVKIIGSVRGVAVTELARRDYNCWGSTKLSGLASALGLTPARLAA